jgi:hypothetical protein
MEPMRRSNEYGAMPDIADASHYEAAPPIPNQNEYDAPTSALN